MKSDMTVEITRTDDLMGFPATKADFIKRGITARITVTSTRSRIGCLIVQYVDQVYALEYGSKFLFDRYMKSLN